MTAVPGVRLEAGFSNAALESQRVFRQCLQALSRPGVVVEVAAKLRGMEPLRAATAALLLTLADYETTVWLDGAARKAPDVGAFLRFHTGAPICDRPEDADFAVVLDPLAMPRLSDFKQGTAEYPDRSTTVLVQVARIRETGPVFKGPGINGSISFWADPLPADFATQLAGNRQSFPCGVDILLVAPAGIVGLPRSSTINADGGR